MLNAQFQVVSIKKVGCFGAKQSERCQAQGFKVDKSITILMV